MKKVTFVKTNPHQHWVGDGFPVRSIFSYNDLDLELSPFLLMDYGGPTEFPATERRLGVGEHPHRGFETVTIVYAGEVEHRDSAGGGGLIRAGDVQWMTAGSGLVHDEFHGTDYAKRGGPFEMVQLWVNLPKKHKMVAPRYQGITSDRIPSVELNGGVGSLRVIAGTYENHQGPAKTYSPIHLWDVSIPWEKSSNSVNSERSARAASSEHSPISPKSVQLEVPENFTTALFVLRGKIHFPDGKIVQNGEMAILEKGGTKIVFEAHEETKLLVLNGQPLGEPVVGYGPFVMNTEAEIHQAMRDYQSGKMGRLA